MKKLLVPLALAIAVGACAKGVTPGSSGPATNGTATTSPSSPAATETTTVKVYYLISFGSKVKLAPEKHRVPKTHAIAKAALEELVHGDPQDPEHSTPYPRDAKINAVTISGGVATVDWSAEVLNASVDAATEAMGIQSVVYTLTEFASITKVRFTVEGKDRGTASNGRTIEDWWGHVGLAGQPWDRDPAIDTLESVTLYTPLDGSSSTGTLKLTGEAAVFEATVGIILRDASGRVVKHTSAMASIGAPDRGTFSETITFTPPAQRETWTLQAFEASEEDGSIVFMEDRKIVVG